MWAVLKGFFKPDTEFSDGFVSLDTNVTSFEPVRQRRLKPTLASADEDDDEFAILEQRIKGYVPGAVLPMLSKESFEDDMRWANEIRHVSVMFVNLGLQVSERQP